MKRKITSIFYKTWDSNNDQGWRKDYGVRGWVPVVIGLWLLVGFVGGILLSVNAADRTRCSATAEQIGVAHDYGFWSGCVVEVDGTWIPLDNYRVSTQK